MEPAMNTSEAIFRSVVEGSPNGIFLMDFEGRIFEWNRSMELITLIPRVEAINRSMFEIMNGLTRDEVRGEEMLGRIHRGYREFLDTGATRSHSLKVENVIQRPDGTRSHIEIMLFRVATALPREGEVKDEALPPGQGGWVSGGIVRDISDRKAAELEIRSVVEDRTRQLSLLYKLMATAGESLELSVILENSLEDILEALGASWGSIYLLHEGERRPEAAVRRPAAATGDSRQVEEAHAAAVVATGSPVSWPFGMALPLKTRGRVTGVLCVEAPAGRGLTPSDQALLASVATQMGLTVEALGLWKRAEQSAILEERERLARELHDSITQLLYSLTLFARTGLDCAERGNSEGAGDRLRTIGSISQQALKEMRLLVYGLRPLALEQDGFAGALRRRFDAVEGRLGLRTRLEVDAFPFPRSIEESLYWVTQEALNNVLKHSGAGEVAVSLCLEDGMATLVVADDGKGFSPEAVVGGGGLGLGNMRLRVERLGGRLDITSTTGKGTRILALVPCGTEETT